MMKPRKTHEEKSHPAGIALPRELIERSRAYAKEHGHGGLSGLTRHLLTEFLARAAETMQGSSRAAEDAGNQKIKKALKQISKAAQEGK
jgi:hypothetical protein